jgi:hypothetical protein
VSVPHQADPHADTDVVNDPALMALRCVGAGHRAIGRYRFLYVAIDKFIKWSEATPVVKINKEVSSEVHQVHHMQIRGPKPDHHRQWVPVY